MHYDKATLNFSYARFEASAGMEDEEVCGGAPDIALLYENMICSSQYHNGIKQYFNCIKQYFIMLN